MYHRKFTVKLLSCEMWVTCPWETTNPQNPSMFRWTMTLLKMSQSCPQHSLFLTHYYVTGLFSELGWKVSLYELICATTHGCSAGCRALRGHCDWCQMSSVISGHVLQSCISRTLHEISSKRVRQIGLERQKKLPGAITLLSLHSCSSDVSRSCCPDGPT